jgi:hypothetical protein
MSDAVRIGLNAVIVAVTEEEPRIVTVSGVGGQADEAGEERFEGLPSGAVDPAADATLERALRRWVSEQAGLELGYVEQLYTFGDRFRYPDEAAGRPRTVSVAYLALTSEATLAGTLEARWRDWYDYLPWEDGRAGHPKLIGAAIAPALLAWVAEGPTEGERQQRRERVDIAFGLGGAHWDGERVLERYELLYGADLVAEARRDREALQRVGLAPRVRPRGTGEAFGRPMALDHRRILASAMGRLRGKLKYRPVVFELLPEAFTLLQLQRLVEALAGVRLHKQNFRRLIERGRLVEGTARLESPARGRPAELFRFRREVLRERPAPGVGLPRR